ncbi:alpha-humulene synthase-like [Carex rostrata]
MIEPKEDMARIALMLGYYRAASRLPATIGMGSSCFDRRVFLGIFEIVGASKGFITGLMYSVDSGAFMCHARKALSMSELTERKICGRMPLLSRSVAQQRGRGNFNYEPTAWSVDTFITHIAPIQKPKEWIEARIRELKEEVRATFGSTIDSVEMVNLIDVIQHFGIGYHFKREIYEALSHLHDAKLVSCDLHHVATRFRLLRQHGFNASSDVFLNFKDDQGNFDENIRKDPKGLLSLYNAGYLSTPGEEILSDAISFARGHLSLMLDDLKSPLKSQVLRALKTPMHRMLPRVEARFYIEEYDEKESKYERLLELAKLDFNTLQCLHLEEMKILSIWWKNLNIGENLKYARERLLESYIIFCWSLYYEDKYSRARIMNAKFNALVAVVDDTFDMYGTYEDCKLLNDAIQRWDEEEVDFLPMYLRNLCHQFITTIKNFEDELEPSEKYRMPYFVKWV